MTTDYDQNPIKVHTDYSLEEMRALQRFNSRRGRLVVGIIALLWVALYFGLYLLFGQYPTDFLGFIVMLALLVLVYLFMSGIFYSKKQYAAVSRMFQKGFYFRFHNEDYLARNNTSDFTGQRPLRYEKLFKVYELKDMFYLFTAKKDAYMISKSGFSSGSPEELRELLKKALPSGKYKG